MAVPAIEFRTGNRAVFASILQTDPPPNIRIQVRIPRRQRSRRGNCVGNRMEAIRRRRWWIRGGRFIRFAHFARATRIGYLVNGMTLGTTGLSPRIFVGDAQGSLAAGTNRFDRHFSRKLGKRDVPTGIVTGPTGAGHCGDYQSFAGMAAKLRQPEMKWNAADLTISYYRIKMP